MFALFKGEEGRRVSKADMMQCQTFPLVTNQERSALAITNPAGKGDGGRGRGHGGGGPGGGGLDRGGPPGVVRDRLHCTYCGKSRHTREMLGSSWSTSKVQHSICSGFFG